MTTDRTRTPPAVLGLTSTRPPEAFQLVRGWVLGSTEELSALRMGILRELVAESGDPATVLDDVADNMVLIATELATNAIQYGLPPTEVSLLHTDHVYLLDIADHGTNGAAEERPPGEGGFGLRIAQRLALDVGWYDEGDTKHVWAVLPDPAT
jgi:serine/threonine-protein kinase RsbW